MKPRTLLTSIVAAAILAVNNLRDREGDARAGKRTLAVRLGARFARREHAACLLAPFALVAALALHDGWTGWLAPLAALPLAVREARLVRAAEGRALNPRLRAAARVGLAIALLLGLAVAVA
mgnify:CR=1 FL=1